MHFKSALILILALPVAGCSTSPKAEASARVKPLVKALAEYHRDTGNYPGQLEELRPRYLSGEVRYFDNRDPGNSWRVNYQRVDRDHFQLRLDSTPCSVADMDQSGKVVATVGPKYQ